MTETSVAQLAALVGGRVLGDATRSITGLADLRAAGPGQLGFVRDAKYHAAAARSRAGALLTAVELPTAASQILVGDVDVAFAKIALHFHPVPRAAAHRVHPTAVVDPDAEIDGPVDIGPHAVVGRCRIGKGSVLMAGATVADGAVLGRDCVLHPHATVYLGGRLGDRVVLHSQAVVASDGFGYAREGATWIKVPHLGSAVVEDDVELGVGTAIDRGTLFDTRIGPRCKIDNLCHIGHNCVLGADIIMAAGTLVAGSTTIGDRCVIAGSVRFAGHLRVVADVRLGGATHVMDDILEPGDYMGHPVLKKRRFLRLLKLMTRMVEPDRPDRPGAEAG